MLLNKLNLMDISEDGSLVYRISNSQQLKKTVFKKNT